MTSTHPEALQGSTKAYEAWMNDRGLSNAPEVQASGAFFSQIDENDENLIFAEIDSPLDAASKLMLQKLAKALAKPTACFVVSKSSYFSLEAFARLLPSLKNVIILGEAFDKATSPIQSYNIVLGPEIKTILEDANAKKEFWHMLKSQNLASSS